MVCSVCWGAIDGCVREAGKNGSALTFRDDRGRVWVVSVFGFESSFNVAGDDRVDF